MKRILLAFLVANATAGAHAQVLPYRISAVIELPGEFYSRGLSNAGHIVGHWRDGGVGRAFVWKDGQINTLPPLDGGAFSNAWGVNSKSQVAGISGHALPGAHAALWTDGVPLDLGTLGGRDSGALDLNEAGVAVGWSDYPGTGSRAFIHKDGVMTNLGSMGWYGSAAVAINNNNVVVGTLRAEHYGSSAFIWDEENGMRYLLDRHYNGPVFDINDKNEALAANGLVVDGEWTIRFFDFGGLDLTNTGWIGGTKAINNINYPAIWHSGQSWFMSDLVEDRMGWQFKDFVAINDSAHVVVSATRGGGLATLYLEPVPEPTTLTALGAACLMIVLRKRRITR